MRREERRKEEQSRADSREERVYEKVMKICI